MLEVEGDVEVKARVSQVVGSRGVIEKGPRACRARGCLRRLACEVLPLQVNVDIAR